VKHIALRSKFTILAINTVALYTSAAGAAPEFKTIDVNPNSGVILAIAASDINADGKMDIVAAGNDDVAWYENPSWERHLIAPAIKKLNVCIALSDLNGDKIPELALGADWQFDNTKTGGALYILKHNEDVKQPWRVTTLLDEQPTLHRIRWADVDGDGKQELIVAPLKGINSTPPSHQESGVDLFLLRQPSGPEAEPWKRERISDALHILHNIWPIAGDGKDHLLAASFEGITRFTRNDDGSWHAEHLADGNPEPLPRSGAGEIKTGHWAKDLPVMATVEPWHGATVVVYVAAKPGALHTVKEWRRIVADPWVAIGHAVGWADFDGDGQDELISGYRGEAPPELKPGLNLYDFSIDNANLEKTVVTKTSIDRGGMATEDAVIADFNEDGRPDVAAGGRSTKNIRLYLNLGTTGTDNPK
jgi:hypothetical protein